MTTAEDYAQVQEWMKGEVRAWRRKPPLYLDMHRVADPGIAYAAYEMPSKGVPAGKGLDFVRACIAVRLSRIVDADRRASVPRVVLDMADATYWDVGMISAALAAGRSTPPYLVQDDVDGLFVVATDRAMKDLRPRRMPIGLDGPRSVMASGILLQFDPAIAWTMEAAVESKARLTARADDLAAFHQAVKDHPAPPGFGSTPKHGASVIDMGDRWQISSPYDPVLVASLRNLPHGMAKFDGPTKAWIVSKDATANLTSEDFPDYVRDAVGRADRASRTRAVPSPSS